jgi:signal transduction histidine kinase
LADQFRAEQQRRYAAQAQLVEQLKFNNDALEKTVSDRTLKLQQSLSHEQSVLEQYKRFGALISHEFRNPLGIIKSQLSLLRIEQERNELQLAKRLSVMGSACDRLTAMFDKWLQGDKLSTALKQMDMNPIPVRSWLAHFVATNVYCLLGSPVQVRGATDGMLLMADEYLIDIALGNLVDNARKYAGDATVAIEVRLRPGQLGLAVVDHGPGIAAQHQPRVFDEYFRISPEIGVHGVGLGLSIVRRIVAAHGGELELQSPPAWGALSPCGCH